MEERRTTSATTTLDVTSECPYCGNFDYMDSDIYEYFDGQELSAKECYYEHTCEECKKIYVITSIDY